MGLIFSKAYFTFRSSTHIHKHTSASDRSKDRLTGGKSGNSRIRRPPTFPELPFRSCRLVPCGIRVAAASLPRPEAARHESFRRDGRHSLRPGSRGLGSGNPVGLPSDLATPGGLGVLPGRRDFLHPSLQARQVSSGDLLNRAAAGHLRAHTGGSPDLGLRSADPPGR